MWQRFPVSAEAPCATFHPDFTLTFQEALCTSPTYSFDGLLRGMHDGPGIVIIPREREI